MKNISSIAAFMLLLCACSKKNDASVNPISSLPAANGQTVSVVINETQPGYVIPANFEGLSYEIGILTKVPSYLNANNTVLIKLIKNLGIGVLRIGGNSSDNIWWTDKPRSTSTSTDSLTTTDIDTFNSFVQATGWPVLFGLDLGVYNVNAATNEAVYVTNSFKNLLYALQNGNEPDLFYNNGHRNAAYTYNNYQADWLNYFTSIRQRLPQSSFAGPDVAYNTKWIIPFADNQNANIILLDGHYYNTGPATDPGITYQTILAPNTKLPAYLQTLYSASSKYKLPFRISECNSVYDGGKAGVSDVFASTLWALDFMWQVAVNNGQGVNFHGGNSGAYTPIALDNNVITARPEYYAMLAFKYGGTGGAIVPVTLSQTSYNCTAYACVNNGNTQVTLINKDTVNLSYNIRLDKNVSSVQINRLTAPSVTSKTGITLAGSSVNADGSYTPQNLDNYNVTGRSLIINVPAASAAIVTVKQ